MEIIKFLVIIFIIGVIRALFSYAISALFSAGKAAVTSGDFKENFNKNFHGMPDPQVRVRDDVIKGEKGEFSLKVVEVMGKFPITTNVRAALVVSVLDITSGDGEPVLSLIESMTEDKTTAFQQLTDIGIAKMGYGYENWVRIGGILPDMIETPHKGKRKLLVIVRMVEVNNMPSINLGFHSGKEGILWMSSAEFNCEIKYPGYRDEEENRIIAHTNIVRLAVKSACVDEVFEESEGQAIKEWMQNIVYGYRDSKIEEVKTRLNEAFKESFEEATSGNKDITNICRAINELGNNGYKYAAIELCYDVVAADKVIDESEAILINKISDLLNLDRNEVEKIKDRKLIDLDTTKDQSAGSLEALLGINSDMSEQEINSHLRKEFQKWNSRLNTLEEGDERDNAQKMLDLISNYRNDRAA